MNTQTNNPSRGFSLVEILVALVILSVGLLGLAGLQSSSLRATDSAYLRTQANLLAYNLFDRMRANVTEAKGGAYDRALDDAAPTNPPDCVLSTANPTPDCTPAELTAWDLSQWLDLVAELPDGKASVSTDTSTANTQITITLQWSQRGLQKTEDNSPASLTVTTAF